MLGAAVAVGSAIVVAPAFALGLTAAAVFTSLLIRASSWIVVYLLAVALCQPTLLRVLPDTFTYWIVLKRLDEFSLAAFAPIAFVMLIKSGVSPFTRLTTIGLLLVAGIGLFGFATGGTPAPVAFLDAFLLAKGLMFFMIVRAFPPSESKARSVCLAFLVFAVIAAALGIIELLATDAFRTIIPLARAALRHGIVCLVSVFDSEGQAGWFFAFSATAAFAFYLVYRRQGLFAVFVFFAACSMLTLRRKPFGGLALMMVVASLLSSRLSQKLRVALLLLGVIIVVVFAFGDTVAPIFLEGYEQYFNPSDPYKVARNAMYLTSFRLASDYFPFGPGFGVFGGFASQMYYSSIYYEYGLSRVWGLSPEYSRFMMDAFWPHVLGQFGFFGLAAFCMIFIGIWRPVLQVYRNAKTPWLRAIALASLLTFVEALVESTAESTFESTLSAFMIFGLAALAVSAAQRQQESPRQA
jgi:hypothetical protein